MIVNYKFNNINRITYFVVIEIKILYPFMMMIFHCRLTRAKIRITVFWLANHKPIYYRFIDYLSISSIGNVLFKKCQEMALRVYSYYISISISFSFFFCISFAAFLRWRWFQYLYLIHLALLFIIFMYISSVKNVLKKFQYLINIIILFKSKKNLFHSSIYCNFYILYMYLIYIYCFILYIFFYSFIFFIYY